MELKHRRDIDGLRALAVLPVVLFHAGVPGFGGGFVGVDVFFVISGFLITSLIAGEIDRDAFSLAGFYERRVRRIAPALIVVVLATLAAGWFLLIPADYAALGTSAIAAVLSFANFHFWADSDYFSTAAELKPLLHTWSLSVEEQFYVVFPLLLWVLMKKARAQLMWWIGGLALVSLAVSSVLAFTHPEQAFYAPWSRAWELLLGSAVALGRFRVPGAAAQTATGIVGVAMIAAAVAFFTEATPFPGLAAVLPSLGAALVIHAGRMREGPVQQVLGFPVLVWIGLISYSLYLWHWPVLVYWRIAAGALPGGWVLAGLIAAMIALSALSWAVVEQPFRNRRRMGRRTVFAVALCAAVVSVGAAAGVMAAKGVPARLPDRINAILAAGEDPGHFGAPPCFIFEGGGPSADDIRAGKLCGLGVAEGPVAFLFIGDSHAGAMAPGVDAAAKRQGLHGLFIGQASCPPLLDYQRSADAKYASCKTTNAAAVELVARLKIPHVLMTSRWARYVNGTTFGNDGPFFDPALPIASEDHSAEIAAKLEQTVAAYLAAGAQPVLSADAPEIGYDASYVTAREALQGREADLDPSVAVVMERQRLSLRVLSDVAAAHGLTLLKQSDVLCGPETCKTRDGDVLLYRDEDHLSEAGALLVSALFDPVFAKMAGK